jgi:PAS domain S-box-containing protein
MERTDIEKTVALLEATVESTRDAILVVDLNRRIVRYNQRYLTMFGLTRDHVDAGGMAAVDAALRDQLADFDDVMIRSREIWRDPSREMLDKLTFKVGRVF